MFTTVKTDEFVKLETSVFFKRLTLNSFTYCKFYLLDNDKYSIHIDVSNYTCEFYFVPSELKHELEDVPCYVLEPSFDKCIVVYFGNNLKFNFYEYYEYLEFCDFCGIKPQFSDFKDLYLGEGC